MDQDQAQADGKTCHPGVAELAAEKLSEKYPGIVIAGTNDGYFSDDEPIIDKINAAKPDLLLVCLGAPKQEKWMKKNADKLSAKLAIGLGGSLDVYAGVVELNTKSTENRINPCLHSVGIYDIISTRR